MIAAIFFLIGLVTGYGSLVSFIGFIDECDCFKCRLVAFACFLVLGLATGWLWGLI